MEKLYTVYWARSADMTDVSAEGYVGISVDFSHRQCSHKKAANAGKPGAFYSWVRKHGFDSVVWEVLHSGVGQDRALQIEAQLRPEGRIGWNSQRGGELGVEPEWYDDEDNAARHAEATSVATRLAIAAEEPGARSARAKKAWEDPEYRAAQSEAMSGDNNNCAGMFGEDHPAFGYRHSDDAKRRISEANSGEKCTFSKVSDEDRAEMCAAYAAGESFASIARRYPVTGGGVSYTVKSWGPKNGFPFLPASLRSCVKFWEPPKCATGVSDSVKALICVRRMAGESYKSIASGSPYKLTGVRSVCMNWGPKNGFPYKASFVRAA